MNLNLSLKMSDFGPYLVYTGFGMSYYEKFLPKYFFRKVHIILNIFHIYDFASKWILTKLQAIEISSKNVILSSNLIKIFTSGLDSTCIGACISLNFKIFSQFFFRSPDRPYRPSLSLRENVRPSGGGVYCRRRGDITTIFFD